jgi:hypothetical protein
MSCHMCLFVHAYLQIYHPFGEYGRFELELLLSFYLRNSMRGLPYRLCLSMLVLIVKKHLLLWPCLRAFFFFMMVSSFCQQEFTHLRYFCQGRWYHLSLIWQSMNRWYRSMHLLAFILRCLLSSYHLLIIGFYRNDRIRFEIDLFRLPIGWWWLSLIGCSLWSRPLRRWGCNLLAFSLRRCIWLVWFERVVFEDSRACVP